MTCSVVRDLPQTGSDLRIADGDKERGVFDAGKAAEADTAQWVNDIFHRRDRSGEDPVCRVLFCASGRP